MYWGVQKHRNGVTGYALRFCDLITRTSWRFFRYNWSPAIIPQEVKAAQITSGTEYVPMIWGEKDLTDARLSFLSSLGQCANLLGFNEPNFGTEVPKEASLRSLRRSILPHSTLRVQRPYLVRGNFAVELLFALMVIDKRCPHVLVRLSSLSRR